MNRIILPVAAAMLLLAGGAGRAEPLNVELVMGRNTWRGTIVKRDGDRIEFLRLGSTQPIQIGVNTINSLNFSVTVDGDRINQLMAAREFDKVIELVNETLEPFAAYKDIPSNLTRYEAALMELYYQAGRYDESLALARKIVEDDRDPVLQSKARNFQALALIETGETEAAQSLVATYGWDRESSKETPADELYIKAKLMMLRGEYRPALLDAAKVVVFHSQDPDWMQRAELLCAELYAELGMYDSAEEVCRQIMLLYRNTPEFDAANRLLEKVERLRGEQQPVSEET